MEVRDLIYLLSKQPQTAEICFTTTRYIPEGDEIKTEEYFALSGESFTDVSYDADDELVLINVDPEILRGMNTLTIVKKD